MEFKTEVKITAQQLLQLENPFLLIGSCFSVNIGKKLSDLKMDTVMNPFGIVYQPEAIAYALECIMAKRQYDTSDLIEHEGLYHSPNHHGSFSSHDPGQTLQNINLQIEKALQQLLKPNLVLLITWGTAKGFKAKNTGKWVGNCHKIPSYSFDSFIETPEDIVARYKEIFSQLLVLNPTLKIIFSISPVRHKRDGFVANQHSKSVLFVALHRLLKSDQFYYFPAYEIVMDELRDYRFYDTDMLHPSELAVEYIWDKFKLQYFDSATQQAICEIENLNKQ